jgi:hypothetical protein
MKLSQIAPDDALLFGSLAALALGCGAVVAATAQNALLALGVVLVAFGLPSAVVAFLAAQGASE